MGMNSIVGNVSMDFIAFQSHSRNNVLCELSITFTSEKGIHWQATLRSPAKRDQLNLPGIRRVKHGTAGIT